MLDIMIMTNKDPETGERSIGFSGHLNMDAEETLRMMFEKDILKICNMSFEQFITELDFEMHSTAVRAIARIRQMYEEDMHT